MLIRARAAWLTAMIAIVVAAAGCSSHSAANGSKPAPKANSATLNVVNTHWNDVRIFAVRGSAKHRLGMVTSMSSARFDIPEYLYRVKGQVVLRVEPIGSAEAFESLPVPCEPGALIEWRIRKILYYSSAMVY